MFFRMGILFLAGGLAFGAGASRAEAPAGAASTPAQLPVLELGVFGGVGQLPHYRGSDEYTTYYLPVPFFIYRGKVLRANREGVRSIFWENDRFETGISMGGNPPVDGNNDARRGMPELGAVGEIGPMLKWYFRSRQHPDPLYALAAVRLALSLDTGDFSIADEGCRGDLRLIYRNTTWLQKWGVDFGVNGTVDFADDRYHAYFYDVAEPFANANRPAYSAGGGYSGFSLSANVVKQLNPRLKFGFYYRWDNLAGSVYRDSPLVRTENNHIYGLALIWNFYRSKALSPYSEQ